MLTITTMIKRCQIMQLTKENLQDFIANYAIPFNPLTDNL